MFFVLLFLGTCYFVTLTPDITEAYTRAYIERLTPLALWLAGISALTLSTLLIWRYGLAPRKILPRGRVFYIALIIFGLIFALWIWIVRSQYKTESTITGWNSLGIPILETQVLIAFGIGVLFSFILILLSRRTKIGSEQTGLLNYRTLDVIISLILWLSTIFLFERVPITPTWFVSQTRSPNYEYYPNSDALSYDMSAQMLLAGEGLQFVGTHFVRRPMHALFLTALHVLGGQDYEKVVFFQIAVLATLPVALYCLTKRLHNRMSGIMVAILITLRETNSIAIADTITASHAKLLMADLPAALTTAWFMYVTVVWFQERERTPLHALLAGGLLGITTLIRPEIGTLFLVVPVFAILIFRKNLRFWFKSTLLFTLGILLILAPWVWRNWSTTGLIFLDSPSFRFELLADRYQKSEITPTPTTPTNTIDQSPASTQGASAVFPPTPQSTQAPQANSEPILMDYAEYVRNTTNNLASFARENTGLVVSFVTAHYLNSQTQIFLTLPTSIRAMDSAISFFGHRSPEMLWYECCSLSGYIRRLPFWHQWNGYIPSQTIIPLVVNLFIIAIGIQEAWKKQKLIGLFPIIASAYYILVNAIFRNSGGRYILPVDWVGVLYYCIGLSRLFLWGVSLFSQNQTALKLESLLEQAETTPDNFQKDLLRNPKFYALSIALLLIGSLPVVVERSIPPIYVDSLKNESLNALMESELLLASDRSTLNALLDDNGTILLGRALYPRFYRANRGEPDNDNPMEAKPFSRIGFYIAGPENRPIIMPLDEPPEYFPNTSTVMVFGCQGVEFQTLAVAIFDSTNSPEAFLLRDPLPATLACPLEIIEIP